MKAVRGILVLAVVFIASTQVFALTTPPWGGAFSASLNIWANSKVYTGYLKDQGPLAYPTDPTKWVPATLGVTYGVDAGYNLADLETTVSDGGMQGETGWGVFRIYNVHQSSPSGKNGMSPGDTIWEHGDGGKEIVGIYYNQYDVSVRFNGSDPNNPFSWTQDIISDGAEYMMWYQNLGIFKAGEGLDLSGDGNTNYDTGVVGETDANGDGCEDGEEGWLLRFGSNQYKTIGYYDDGTPITDPTVSELVLHGTNWDQIKVNFDMTQQAGRVHNLIELTNSPEYAWQPWPDNEDSYFMRIFPYDLNKFIFGVIPNPGYSPYPGMEAHLYLNAFTQAATRYGWDLISSDNSSLFGQVVPEPVTMISLALGGMGLVGYIRKRRNK